MTLELRIGALIHDKIEGIGRVFQLTQRDIVLAQARKDADRRRREAAEREALAARQAEEEKLARLRQRLLRPSMNLEEIEPRLGAVEELLAETILRARLREQLADVLDIERLLAKVSLASAGPRDVLALGRSLQQVPALREAIGACRSARRG